jgi:hypothetical protein
MSHAPVAGWMTIAGVVKIQSAATTSRVVSRSATRSRARCAPHR